MLMHGFFYFHFGLADFSVEIERILPAHYMISGFPQERMPTTGLATTLRCTLHAQHQSRQIILLEILQRAGCQGGASPPLWQLP